MKIKNIFDKWSVARKQKRFEKQYQAGGWKELETLGELGHNSIIIGYIRFLKPLARVLDIGCGEGALCKQLGAESYRKYTGIDFSETAVSNANTKNCANAEFIAEDAHTFEPSEKYDVVVFNESLYYLKKPLVVLKKYIRCLFDDGIIIVSIFGQKKLELFEIIDAEFEIMDMLKVSKSGDTFWTVKVYKNKTGNHGN